jgi:hypothetical protein
MFLPAYLDESRDVKIYGFFSPPHNFGCAIGCQTRRIEGQPRGRGARRGAGLNENARDPVGSLAFHHEELAVLIGCCAFRLPRGHPATCAANQPFGLAFRLTADLRRLPILRRRLPTQPPTEYRHQIQRPAIRLISGLRLRPTLRPNLPANPRLAPPTDFPAPPFDRRATVAACRPSGHAFR